MSSDQAEKPEDTAAASAAVEPRQHSLSLSPRWRWLDSVVGGGGEGGSGDGARAELLHLHGVQTFHFGHRALATFIYLGLGQNCVNFITGSGFMVVAEFTKFILRHV